MHYYCCLVYKIIHQKCKKYMCSKHLYFLELFYNDQDYFCWIFSAIGGKKSELYSLVMF